MNYSLKISFIILVGCFLIPQISLAKDYTCLGSLEIKRLQAENEVYHFSFDIKDRWFKPDIISLQFSDFPYSKVRFSQGITFQTDSYQVDDFHPTSFIADINFTGKNTIYLNGQISFKTKEHDKDWSISHTGQFELNANQIINTQINYHTNSSGLKKDFIPEFKLDCR